MFARHSMGLYLGLIMVLLPLVSILRSLNTISPGEVRNTILPILLFLIMFSFGFKKIIKPRNYLQYIILLIFFQAAIIGGLNLVNDDVTLRSYLSHLFQVGSAYIMLGVGWQAINTFSYRFWKWWTRASLLAVLLSTILILIALGAGDIGRLYTPAYTLIFVMSFSLIYSKKTSMISYGGLLVSNKRGPILSVIIMQLFFSFTSSWKKKNTGEFLIGLMKLIVYFVIGLILLWSVVKWAEDIPSGESAIASAVNITFSRLSIFESNDEKSLDDLTSGRLVEINNSLDSAEWDTWIIGSGAGWEVDIGRSDLVHNIHFSPLSIAMVFGAPFAIFLYGSILFSLFFYSSQRVELKGLSTTEKMAPFYVMGGLVHSFTAYSLFIDLLFFFFLGVLLHTLKNARL